METYELRYFLAVARAESVREASQTLRVSPASLSKAIARLEGELSTRLFAREGRGIRLTEQGRLLKERAAQILAIEESARAELAGRRAALHVVLAGPEPLLAHYGQGVVDRIRARHPACTVEHQCCDDDQALTRVRSGDAALAIVSGPVSSALTARELGRVEFRTAVGRSHPLARSAQPLPIEKVLAHGFACPAASWLGRVGARSSSDGWRDDEFPRRIEQTTSSLKILERIVVAGRAVAYLPDYLVGELGLTALRITGCPYRCTQTIRLVARRPKESSWLKPLFDTAARPLSPS
jgi:DNA-binding transcriptional LysR family regulator